MNFGRSCNSHLIHIINARKIQPNVLKTYLLNKSLEALQAIKKYIRILWIIFIWLIRLSALSTWRENSFAAWKLDQLIKVIFLSPRLFSQKKIRVRMILLVLWNHYNPAWLWPNYLVFFLSTFPMQSCIHWSKKYSQATRF